MIYACCDENRRNEVLGSALNGIDYLEVLDELSQPIADRQRTLYVHFINNLASGFSAENICIEGGERIRDIQVIIDPVDNGKVLTVEVDQAGDFSIYTLRLITSDWDHSPPTGIDPILAAVDFSFKVQCPSDFDCKEDRICLPEPPMAPQINYLAKDYASFRRLMIDRMALLMPQWQERNAADLGVVLIELLAYVGDRLSYHQDAVATEAYLKTARSRVSVRRHARLVDYYMHDGCNARSWVQVQVDSTHVTLLQRINFNGREQTTKLLTRVLNQPTIIEPESREFQNAVAAGSLIFELMEEAELYQDHNEMFFYTWDDQECCLPAGATHAALSRHYPNLKTGDVLVFEEIKGPRTGVAGDADPTKRHPVRLVDVVHTESGSPLVDPLHPAVQITRIAWAKEDALPFPLCISSRTDVEHDQVFVENVSVARGNIVLADHGLTIEKKFIGTVPSVSLYSVPRNKTGYCEERQRLPVVPRFRPSLDQGPLTQGGNYHNDASAAAAMAWSMRDVTPYIKLASILDTDTKDWSVQRDLLQSGKFDTHFVVEIENNGTASIRFGDDLHGLEPEPSTDLSPHEFEAHCRVGNGVSGNIGVDSLVHIVTNQMNISTVRNILPTQGGVEPESMEDGRKNAPQAFRTQERAVTQEDYAEMAERKSAIQEAEATFRWTGSWHTVFMTVDREGGLEVDNDFKKEMVDHLERYRMAGYDLNVDAPRYLPLQIEMQVCVKPDYFRSDVKQDLLEIFSNGMTLDGQRGVFHPDNFSFGQTVYLSPLYAAAMAVPGVQSVHITTFQRQDNKIDPAPLDDGKLELDRLEIARLDNDPNFSERGVFKLQMGGGK
ncbi:MAG: putative baseplate assembly protein [Gammaproteobacteria bacterium]|nr:putative baseplate assembly protein [Gammaproteobacteria bacterium]